MSSEGPETKPRSSVGQRVKRYFGLGPDVEVATVSATSYRQRLMVMGPLLAVGVLLWWVFSAKTGILFVVVGMVSLFVTPVVHRAMEWWDNYSND